MTGFEKVFLRDLVFTPAECNVECYLVEISLGRSQGFPEVKTLKLKKRNF